MKEDDGEYLALSGIKHFAFCRRRWALIHIEQQWQENDRTAEGHILHEKAHGGQREKRGELIITRNLPVASGKLGISGNCDVVEWHEDEKGVYIPAYKGCYRPVPVEYKRGSPMDNDADSLQLCAQAVCLEEMLLCCIPSGYLYFNEIRRRQEVLFTDELRRRVTDIAEEMHELCSRQYTPRVKRTRMCRSCSMLDLCLPELDRSGRASDYINRMLGDDLP